MTAWAAIKGFMASTEIGLLGFPGARQTRRQDRCRTLSVRSALQFIRDRYHVEPIDTGECPVFILSAGWRSGSTYLQRLLMSSGAVFVWGEPLDHMSIVQRLARALCAYTEEWPDPERVANPQPPERLSDEWIATYHPPPEAVFAGYQALFAQTFIEPVREAGIRRWGIKEVRWGANEAYLLKGLYPQARLIFLVRHPCDAYLSYRRWMDWYLEWPERPVFSVSEFGDHWRKTASELLECYQELGALFVRYEDLAGSHEWVDRIRKFCGLLSVSEELQVVGSSSRTVNMSRKALGYPERWLLKRAVEPIASKLHYRL